MHLYVHSSVFSFLSLPTHALPKSLSCFFVKCGVVKQRRTGQGCNLHLPLPGSAYCSTSLHLGFPSCTAEIMFWDVQLQDFIDALLASSFIMFWALICLECKETSKSFQVFWSSVFGEQFNSTQSTRLEFLFCQNYLGGTSACLYLPAAVESVWCSTEWADEWHSPETDCCCLAPCTSGLPAVCPLICLL